MSPSGAPSLTDRLTRLIAAAGPISVAQYMAEANAHYYATRDPIGAGGDFTTAPEISQMFGELIGLWLADLWTRANCPDACFVEFGPGRGTLARDALRAMRSAGLAPDVHFVEVSAVLRDAQRERVPDAVWHDDLSTLPTDRPLLVVANEFFDALPVHQLVSTGTGWCERMVARGGDGFVAAAGPYIGSGPIPAGLRHAPAGAILETSPAGVAIARDLSSRIAAQGGAALIVDYGHVRTTTGETLQAVLAHEYADPFVDPGTCDLTAHVDFEALIEGARREGVRTCGPRTQGEWLAAMGIALRTEALAKAAPERAQEIAGAAARLTGGDEMGKLFKALALVAPSWPEPSAF